MARRLLYLLPLLCEITLSQPPAQQWVAHGDRVLIPIEVRDSNYRTIRGLQKSDFRIVDENHLVQDFTLSMEDAPASIVVLIDTSESMKSAWGEIPGVILSLFSILQADDEMTLLTFGQYVTRPVSGWTKDRDPMLAAVREASPHGCTALYDGISEAFRVARTGTHDKRVVIVVTDSGDSCSRKQAKDFLREARETRSFLYVLSRYAFLEDQAYYHQLKLREGSEWTGGYFLEYSSAKQIPALVDRINFRERYIASFAPYRSDGTPLLHRVSVQLAGKSSHHARLRWRHAYAVSAERR